MIDYRNEFITNKAGDKNFNEGLRLYMLKIYNYMAIGLLITGSMAFATLNFEPLVQLMYKLTPAREVYGITGFGIIIQLIPLVIAFSFGFANMSVANARILFWLYAITIGMSLSSLGFIYTGQSLVRTFLICSSLFGVMSLYGYSTNKDITSVGSFLIMGLIGLVIISLCKYIYAKLSGKFCTFCSWNRDIYGAYCMGYSKAKRDVLLLWRRRSGTENCHYGSMYLVSRFY